MNDVSFWYCCLNPNERFVFRETGVGLAASLFVGIPVPLWELFWFGLPLSGDARREAFLHIYGLQIVTITPGGGDDPYDAVVPVDLPQWVTWAAWVVSPAGVCVDPCGITIYP